MREKFGICQWFHFEDKKRVHLARTYLRELGILHLRMDVSWADYCRPNGPAWYAWLFDELEEFELLPCVWHTPPSISRNGKSNGPPKHVRQFSEFLYVLLEAHGDRFDAIELWNEPNNWLKWDRKSDPKWQVFANMIEYGAGAVLPYGKTVVLGGMSPIDGEWLKLLQRRKTVLKDVDVIGIHAFPGQWNEPEETWEGWHAVFEYIEKYADGRDIWITETGYSAPKKIHQERQTKRMIEAMVQATQHAKRIYWYTLMDLPNKYDEIEYHIGEYREPLERSLGLVTADGRRKEAFYTLKSLLLGLQ